MGKRVRIFDSGTQFDAWQARNCFGCSKYDAEGPARWCDLDLAMGTAYLGDGKLDAEIVRRLGYDDREGYPWTWDCPEREPVPTSQQSREGETDG